jgi:hypothetical protein
MSIDTLTAHIRAAMPDNAIVLHRLENGVYDLKVSIPYGDVSLVFEQQVVQMTLDGYWDIHGISRHIVHDARRAFKELLWERLMIEGRAKQ